MTYLRLAVAPETDALYPSDLCEECRNIVSDQPCIKCLVEIYMIVVMDNLLYLLQPVITCKNVVVHEDKMRPPVRCYLLHIHIGPYLPLFCRNNTPRAFVRASPCQKAVGSPAVYLRIDGIIGLKYVHLIGKH